MARHPVARAAELKPGERRILTAGRQEIGLYNIGGAFYAVRNHCPHVGAPLCRGEVLGTTVPSEPHAFTYGREGEILVCPWHGWEFEIKTGVCLAHDRTRARVYPVTVEDGIVYVTV